MQMMASVSGLESNPDLEEEVAKISTLINKRRSPEGKIALSAAFLGGF